jgi:hypothetical protein
MNRIVSPPAAFLLPVLLLTLGCGDKPKPVLRSIDGNWRVAGPAYGIMDFEKSGSLKAGPKGSLMDMGSWSMDGDIVTLSTGGSSKKAKIQWTSNDSLKMTPLDAHGEGRPMELTKDADAASH